MCEYRANTVRARYGTGGGTAQSSCNNEDYFVIDRAAFNQGINAQFDIDIRGGGAAPTLVARGPHAVATPLGKSR